MDQQWPLRLPLYPIVESFYLGSVIMQPEYEIILGGWNQMVVISARMTEHLLLLQLENRCSQMQLWVQRNQIFVGSNQVS